jgi:uncharacterized protein
MHVTLHITTGCNLFCKYCYAPPVKRLDMTSETAQKSIDFIVANYPVNTGISFFGGEPLLRKDLIRETVEYGKYREANTSAYFHYKITTNGTMLDSEFLDFADKNKLHIALSMDGNENSHNYYRHFPDGKPTFKLIEEKAKMLLERQPYAKVLMTITPDTLEYYADSFKYLVGLGFKYIIASLDYSGNWTDKHITSLKNEYKKLAELYEKFISEEKKIYFSPFEMKLASHIRKDNFECYHCHLATKQISIAHDGNIYPCVQFVQDGISNRGFIIGNVIDGINKKEQGAIYEQSKEQYEACKDCDYLNRCNNKCSCLNWQLTKDINKISPVICETERVLIPIVDELGNRMYSKKYPLFIQKHYNAVYPILSMIEDMR